jgi:hypothetical protein
MTVVANSISMNSGRRKEGRKGNKISFLCSGINHGLATPRQHQNVLFCLPARLEAPTDLVFFLAFLGPAANWSVMDARPGMKLARCRVYRGSKWDSQKLLVQTNMTL